MEIKFWEKKKINFVSKIVYYMAMKYRMHALKKVLEENKN